MVEQSFKVFERPAANKSFDGGLKFAKSANAPGVYGRSKTAPAPLEHDNMFENVMKSRYVKIRIEDIGCPFYTEQMC